ncbi:MAG: EAL domain-containing protein [Pseudomonas sp.]|uniref:putative bifunctional diguanylate cyclase/phosphodiesterase n=1 Tax=Pseudomonas sp. TaxID=306 RepID=UPI002736EEB6|nr:EAL domain-containing protein [Pseudomonas sp.]MDP3847483.1 EAL domain-containing protein [Pseudomonas sp.]
MPLPNSSNAPPCLLVVDDQETNREIFSRRLERHGYRVLLAASGQDALNLVAGAPPELILLDIMMPDMDGLEVLDRLRQRYSQQELPIIMVTARSQSEVIVDALARGANDYLIKPFDFAVALARVRTQLAFRRAEQAIEESREFYQLIAHSSNDGVWDWNRRARSIFFSPRLKSILGYAQDDHADRLDTWLARVYAADLGKLKAAFKAHLAGRTPQLQVEVRVYNQAGDCCWLLCRGQGKRDAQGRIVRLAGSCTDLTERKTMDALTNLPNRVLFDDRLERCLRRRARHPDARFALLLIEPDRFHLIHESLGHHISNLLLIDLARRLQQLARPSDTLAYFGGVKFAVLIDSLEQQEDALRVAERMQRAFAEPLSHEQQEFFVTPSMGVAVIDQCQGGDLLQAAETALGRAKERGGNDYQMFDAAMQVRVLARMRLEHDLRRALEHQEFELHYQPIVDLGSGRIAGFEALCRWHHPQQGMVSPELFIPLAESTGLIIPLGLWVLRQAVAQIRDWQQRFPAETELGMSVNLSGKQFAQKGLLEEIARTLQDSGVNHHSLKLEITESAIMNDADNANLLLARFKELDIQLSIDDFGTGYSSLSYLHRFPFDILKVDRSFVGKMDQDRQGLEIVRTIIALAQVLGLKVVAEGIETPTQLALLRELGCHFGQGYLFAKPLPASAAQALLAREPRW